MGYNTTFKGEIFFNQELTAKQLAQVKKFLGEDYRDHTEWQGDYGDLTYIDLVFTNDFSGLRWDDETEKTHDLDQAIKLIIDNMRKTVPGFGFRGQLEAQGEDFDDRYTISFNKKGYPIIKRTPIVGQVITCPKCYQNFVLGEEE